MQEVEDAVHLPGVGKSGSMASCEAVSCAPEVTICLLMASSPAHRFLIKRSVVIILLVEPPPFDRVPVTEN